MREEGLSEDRVREDGQWEGVDRETFMTGTLRPVVTVVTRPTRSVFTVNNTEVIVPIFTTLL